MIPRDPGKWTRLELLGYWLGVLLCLAMPWMLECGVRLVSPR